MKLHSGIELKHGADGCGDVVTRIAEFWLLRVPGPDSKVLVTVECRQLDADKVRSLYVDNINVAFVYYKSVDLNLCAIISNFVTL